MEQERVIENKIPRIKDKLFVPLSNIFIVQCLQLPPRFIYFLLSLLTILDCLFALFFIIPQSLFVLSFCLYLFCLNFNNYHTHTAQAHIIVNGTDPSQLGTRGQQQQQQQQGRMRERKKTPKVSHQSRRRQYLMKLFSLSFFLSLAPIFARI